MDRPRYKRQLFFFLLAVLVPSTALVIFGVGFLAQERELARNRAEQERAAFARDTGRLLEDRLDQMAEEASAMAADSLRFPTGGGLLWLGRYDGTRFFPAWSFQPVPPPVDWGAQEAALQAAERLEFRADDPSAAADEYAHISRHAPDARRAAFAGIRAARALRTAGLEGTATMLAKQVLDTEFGVQDQFGIPLAYYAADQLLQQDADSLRRQVAARLSEDTRNSRWFAPERAYMLRDLLTLAIDADSAVSTDFSESLRSAQGRAEETHYTLGLRDDLPGLVQSGALERWLRYGDRLLGAGPASSDGRRNLFAVDTTSLAGLAAEPALVLNIHWEGEQPDDALSLRPYLREVYITLGPLETLSYRLPLGIFALVLFMLVGLTFFGGYLLWRDVQREHRLAQLRTQFVSSVSHEFRTPLTAIRMFAEVMMTSDDTPTEHLRYLGVVSNESDRLTRMLNNVLSAARIEQGTSTYQFTQGDLREPVIAAVEAMRYTFDQQTVTLTMDLPKNAAAAAIDADALEQGVLNLLSNALKYGAGKPVSIEVRAGAPEEWDILVSDGGRGIDPTERELIFERFYRAAPAENGRSTGVGLGLSLVKHMAEAHGGRVSLTSSRDQGSTFGIHLPKTP